MKKPIILIITFCFLFISSKRILAQEQEDTKAKVQELKDRLDGIDERLANDEADLGSLKKIKISGYIQSQFEKYEANVYPKSTFFLRRVRVKTTYEAADGVKFVVQPDFVVNAVTLKDAYVVVNDPWFNTFQLWAGQFNRPNYEVEYSSSSREVPERSKMILSQYPGEREVGLKLEANPSSIPLQVQIALLNGNFTGSQNKDIDNFKDIMARVVYTFNMPESGLSMDIGASTYMGNVRATSTTVNKGDYTADANVQIGDAISKSWFGGEFRLYWDFLGGLALKGEYMTGNNATPAAGTTTPNQLKDFSGYYLYLIKNIGASNQLVLKYDNYDPNTKLSGDDIGSIKGSGAGDIAYNTLTLAWQNYWDDNVRITFAYAMPMNEKSANLAGYNRIIPGNTFTLRIQSKF